MSDVIVNTPVFFQILDECVFISIFNHGSKLNLVKSCTSEIIASHFNLINISFNV